MKKVWETYLWEETFRLGEAMGKEAKPGEIYCLDGDLGVGKTVFTKGFAQGLEITEHVTSPTFTIVNEYEGRLPLYHFDVYRVAGEEAMEDTGYEDYFYGTGVCLVEWGMMIPHFIPPYATHILIEKDYSKGDDYRRITRTQEADV